MTNATTEAIARKPSSTRCPDSRTRSRTVRPERRDAMTSAMITTTDQPSPSSSRFEPVMFAAAYGTYAGSLPAVWAKYRSTAYSGSTAITARIAIAIGPEMSTRAASAAQARRNDDATTAVPNSSRPSGPGGCVPVNRNAKAGIVNPIASTRGRIRVVGTASLRWQSAEPEVWEAPARHGHWPKVSSTRTCGPGAGGSRTTVCRRPG
jgi:hypothetical protein